MLALGVAEFNIEAYRTWITVGGGALAAVLAFLLGFLMLNRRRGQSSPSGSGADRRGSPRRSVSNLPILITDARSQATPFRAFLVDRSSGGLGLWVDQPFEVGTTLNIRPEDAPARISWTQVEVRYCYKPGSHWKLGCRFIENPPEDW